MAREFVSVTALGRTTADEIVIAFYGPRGGTRAIESVSLEQARKLHTQLGLAIEAMERAGGGATHPEIERKY
jgi:hypothetical protein